VRVTPWLVAALCAALGAATAAAAPTRALVVSLDVVEDRAPDWLCILTQVKCKAGGDCEIGELSAIEAALEDRGAGRYGFRSDAQLGKLPVGLTTALRALARPPPGEDVCSREDHGGCTPEVDLRQFGRTPTPRLPSRLAGRIVCGIRQGAETPRAPTADADATAGSLKGRRVAFLALTFSDPTRPVSGIQDITFVGTTANVSFERALDASTITFVQVIGGDYAASESSAIGTHENVVVKLHPRCTRVLAEVPAHTAAIDSVSITSASLGTTCHASSPGSRTIVLEVPYISASEDKRMMVRYATRPQPTTSEVRWTDAAPPSPLRLGVRSIQFTWRRPPRCLAERWTEPTPAAERATWSPSCPRATLAEFTTCTVISPEPADRGELAACEYRCDVEDKLDPLALPIAVRFDRIRWNPTTTQSEVLYSWPDQVGFSGQELTSVVAPADRRVMLEFEDPAAWLGERGDRLDAIRIVSGHSSDQLDLTRGNDEGRRSPWVSLSTPGRTCSDRVRLAITGTRTYDETTFDADHARIRLTRPYDYRPRLRGYALAGVGVIYRELLRGGTALGDLGLGAQYDLGGPLSIDLEVAGQVTKTFYRGIAIVDHAAPLVGVPYARFDVRGAVEWWAYRSLGVAAAIGGGFGTPLDLSDVHTVGTLRFSALAEVQPIVFTVSPRRLWLISGVGVRLFEEHMNYMTDFTASPTPGLEHVPQWYLLLRIRGALE
jgi:hypothetical protein